MSLENYFNEVFMSNKPYLIIEQNSYSTIDINYKMSCILDVLKEYKIEYKSVLYKCAEVTFIGSDMIYWIITTKDNIKLKKINGKYELITQLDPISPKDFNNRYVV